MRLLNDGQVIRETFEVERFLGEGAFAEVYRVRHRFLGRQAMKVFKRVGMNLDEIQEMLGEAILLTHIKQEPAKRPQRGAAAANAKLAPGPRLPHGQRPRVRGTHLANRHGLGYVFGSQTGLLAGDGVLGVEYARAPEQVESRFHNVNYLNEKTVRIRLRF